MMEWPVPAPPAPGAFCVPAECLCRGVVSNVVEEKKESASEKIIRKVYDTLDEFRQKGLFCDAVIRCGDKTFSVQRNMMAASSPYFTALFTYGPGPGQKEFVIPEVAPKIMEWLINFVYTLDIPKGLSSVLELLPAADRFQMDGLLKMCCRVLQERMNMDNCLKIRAVAKIFYSCRHLVEAADHQVMKNFAGLAFSAEFLQLDCEDMSSIISSDQLNVRSEALVLDAVYRWVLYDFDDRYPQECHQLLCHVRMGLLNTEDFSKTMAYIGMHATCYAFHAILSDTYRIMASPETRSSKNYSKPRLP